MENNPKELSEDVLQFIEQIINEKYNISEGESANVQGILEKITDQVYNVIPLQNQSMATTFSEIVVAFGELITEQAINMKETQIKLNQAVINNNKRVTYIESYNFENLVTMEAGVNISSVATLTNLIVQGYSRLKDVSINGFAQLYGDLSVNGLTNMYDLSVSNMTTLNDVSINGFAQLYNDLSVNGLTNMNDLSVSNMTTLNDVSINGFAQLYSNLSVNGLTNMNDLSVSNMTTMNDVSINGFAQLYSDLSVNGLTNMNDLSVSNMTTLNDVSINGFAQLYSDLSVNGLTNMNDLSVSNMTTLNDVSINGFAQLYGDLSVNGLTNMNDLSVSNMAILNDVSINGILETTSNIKTRPSYINNVSISGSSETPDLPPFTTLSEWIGIFDLSCTNPVHNIPDSGLTHTADLSFSSIYYSNIPPQCYTSNPNELFQILTGDLSNVFKNTLIEVNFSATGTFSHEGSIELVMSNGIEHSIDTCSIFSDKPRTMCFGPQFFLGYGDNPDLSLVYNLHFHLDLSANKHKEEDNIEFTFTQNPRMIIKITNLI